MTGNLTLEANFGPDPFAPATGAYCGLFYEVDEARVDSSGFFTGKIGPTGIYYFRLQLGAGRYVITGQLGVDLRATNVIQRLGLSSLTIELDLSGGTARMSGRVTDGSWVADLSGVRGVFNKTNPAPYAGTFTLVMP